MERREKQPGSSPPSFASELFGSKETHRYPSSSTGIFSSMFGPPSISKVWGKESLQTTKDEKNHGFVSETWNSESDDTLKISEDVSIKSIHNMEMNYSNYHEDQRAHPCHLSSSIFYGGQESYYHPQSTISFNSTNKKDGGEDDLESASRGNWWQGSLYY